MPIRRYRYTKLRWRILVRLFDLIGGLFALAWRFFRPVEIPAETRRILIVQLDHLGDSVLTSPLLPVLKRAYPAARIDVLASPSNRAVFQADEHISNVIVADRNWFDRRPGRFALATAVARIGLSLRGGGYDLGIDVRGDVLTVLVLCLAGIPRRLGWEMGGGGFLLTDRAEWVPGRHEVESRLALAEALGIDAQADGGPRVAVGVIDRDRSRVARLLCEAWPSKSRLRIPATVAAGEIDSLDFARRRSSARGEIEADWLHAGRFGEEAPLLAVHVGAGTAAKRWPAGHWRDLLNRFLEDGWRVLVVGGPDGEPMADGLPDHENLRDWSGLLAVTETAALLERADLFIGADSGPAHLAACAGVPSVVLFSGTNHAAQWRPWSRRTLVLRHQVACRPCHRKVCPFADHPCMAGLTPGVVFDRARRWWAEGSGAEVQDVVS